MKKISFLIIVLIVFENGYAGSVPVLNHSFENPTTQYVDAVVWDWDEIDLDPDSQNTGVFLNSPGETYITNADANQVGYVIGMDGNAFQQNISQVYETGRNYRMTVGVCVSMLSRPPSEPGDPLKLAFYYREGTDPNAIDIVTTLVPLAGRSDTLLEDFSVNLPAVQVDDPWKGKQIGIAIRGTGISGGAWDLDDVRVVEYPLVPNFTNDSTVNLEDFAIMAFDWLYCDNPLTDVTGDGCVNEDDLLVLMEYWLSNV